MSKRKKIIILMAIALVLIIATGAYLYPKEIHMPIRMTYPYDVTISEGNARINGYLSNELEIEIPEHIWGVRITSIDKDAFTDLGTDIVIKSIPEGEIMVENIYHKESQGYYKLYRDEAKLIKYVGNEKKVEIPENIWGRTLKYIDSDCFINSKIEEVMIPKTVTYIGGSAFKGCKNLKQIELPSRLEEIEIMCFKESGIESIELSKNVKRIGAEAFKNSDLKEISGLENVECIEHDPFRGTPWEESIKGDFICVDNILLLYRGKDKEVIVPSTVTEIKGAFAIEKEYPYPLKVKKVFLPDSIEVISAYSFDGQDGIEVYIPETVESIGKASSYTDTIFGSYSEVPGTIVTTAGSPAEAYAIEEGISYRIITKEEMQQEMEAAKKRQGNK